MSPQVVPCYALHMFMEAPRMATSVLTLRIPQEIKAKIAQATHRSRSSLPEETIARYVNFEAWQIGEIRQAIQEAGQGDFATLSGMVNLLMNQAD